jgi:phosphoglycerol transferase MdoB-like AlkP superfamily enzyme
MAKQIGFIFRYFLYWILYFLTLKLVFLLYNYQLSFHYLPNWIDIIVHGIRLDLSATGYLMLFPLFIILASIWLRGYWGLITIRVYTIIFLVTFSLLAASDLALYKEWGFRLDITPILYLAKPKEAFASVSFLYVFIHLAIAGIIVGAFIFLFRLFGKKAFYIDLIGKRIKGTIMILFIIGLLILPIRGGIGKSAINTGSSYFSNVNFLNHAALNLPWNVGYSLLNNNVLSNPYSFMKEEKAQSLLDSFIGSDSAYMHILSARRPNIILIIMESFTANVTGCLNGPVQVTPELDRIAHGGILFSQFYASGDRTDKGLLAVLSGFPSQPTTSLIKYINKTEKLPALPKTLKNYGYKSTFYYGGDAEFANYKSYLVNAGFEEIIEMKDFPASQRICNWGVPDEYLFEKALSGIKKESNAYFITFMTLSSHVPYDVPMKPHLPGNAEETKFFNSVYYADQCIGSFIDSLEKENLLKNTLVIFVADHGSRFPGNVGQNNILKYHIPMIWYGGAINRHDTIINTISSQTDIATTLLGQLNIPSDQYLYGKNIFSKNIAHKTVFEIDNGFGYISDSLQYFYYNIPDEYSVTKGNLNETAKMEGKAFYQVLYNDIIHR